MKNGLLFLFLFILPVAGSAQSLVTDVRVQLLDAARLEILYTLTGPTDSVWIEAETRFGSPLHSSPAFLYGDFGRGVQPGVNRRIVWYIHEQGHQIQSDIRIRVLARPRSLPESGSTDKPVPNLLLKAKRWWSLGLGWAI